MYIVHILMISVMLILSGCGYGSSMKKSLVDEMVFLRPEDPFENRRRLAQNEALVAEAMEKQTKSVPNELENFYLPQYYNPYNTAGYFPPMP